MVGLLGHSQPKRQVMKLKLAIIHLDLVLETLELEPGTYNLGRSKENNIVVPHLSLKPKEGCLFFQEGQWFFENSEKTHKEPLGDHGLIHLSDQIALATQEYVETGARQLGQFSQLRGQYQEKQRKRMIMVSGGVACLLFVVLMGYLTVRRESESLQQSRLISRVRGKIVEFEAIRDDRAIGQLKKYAGLKDQDFKASSGFCTGFMVGPNILLTAAHCLMGRLVVDLNTDFYLKTADGKKHGVSRILGFDIKQDYLFLETKGMENYGYLNFAKSYEVEQKVYTIGNVHGQGLAIRDGIISSETTDPDDPGVKFLRYSAGASPGNSGGPLLNRRGDVVALIFAATQSENFNLGTSCEDLRAAYSKYVGQREKPQKVKIQMKRLLNFKAELMLQRLSIPYLPQFDEYPEVVQKFNEIAVEVQVPMDFSQVNPLILAPINREVRETFLKVQDILRQKNEVVLDWKSFLSDQTPMILPSQFDLSQKVFTKRKGRYYPQVAGLIDTPTKVDYSKYKRQFEKEKKFDFQAYGYNIGIFKKPIDLLTSDVFYKPKNESGTKQRFRSLSYGLPHSQMVVFGPKNLRKKNFFGLKLFMKNFIGQQGVIGTTMSPFTRPSSMKDFTIKELDFSDLKQEEVKDGLGRSWKKSWLKVFESINIITYCGDLPEGSICIGRAFLVSNDYLLGIIEKNFRAYILSRLLINPYFWAPGPLATYIKQGKAKASPLMKGVSYHIKGGVLKGQLSRFPFQFEIPNAQKIQSIRLQTGLYKKGDQRHWTGYGLEWVQKEKKKDFVCGLGLEVFGSQAAFILNFLRDRRKQEKLRKIKGEPAKPLPGVWYKPFRGLKTPFQIYGYCAPLEQDPRVAHQYFVDFKKAKALKYKHRVSP